MAGKFVLGRSNNGQFHFVLKAANGEKILSSEMYNSRQSAQGGMASVQKNCTSDALYERKTAANGKLYFNLKATNHQIIGTSQMYASEQSRDIGIASVKTNGTTTVVDDETA